MKHRHVSLLFFLVALLILPAGCGEPEVTESRLDQAHLKVLGIMYGKFMSERRGQAPKNEEEFLGYLNANRPSWEKIVDSAEQLLASPYNQKPLVIFYGDQYTKRNTNGSLWMAYEQAGGGQAGDEQAKGGGQQRVISIRGNVELVDSQQLQQMFPGRE